MGWRAEQGSPCGAVTASEIAPRILGLACAGITILVAAALSNRAVHADLLLPTGIVLLVALAYANGANDVSKAIATLAGSGVTNYKRAIAWGSTCTVLGVLCSALATYFALLLVHGGAA